MKLKMAAAVLIVVGLILAPGYALYATKFSGSLLAREVVYDQSVAVIPTGLAEVRARGAAEQYDMTVRLEPAMNPIRLNAHYSYRPPRAGARHRIRDPYQVAIIPETESPPSAPAVTRELEIIHDRDGDSDATVSVSSGSSSLGMLNVDEAAEYHFAITQPGGGQASLDVTEIALEIRTNVMPVNFMHVTVGGAILLLGIVLLVLTASKDRSSNTADQSATP